MSAPTENEAADLTTRVLVRHVAVGLCFCLVFCALGLPLLLLQFWVSSPTINWLGLLVAGAAAAVTLQIVADRCRKQALDQWTRAHVLLSTVLPYALAAVCAYYAARFEHPWRTDPALGEVGDTWNEVVSGLWALGPSLGAYSFGVAVGMSIFGSLLAGGHIRAIPTRFVGHWMGGVLAALLALFLAERRHLHRFDELGGVDFALHEERIRNAVECLEWHGSLLRHRKVCLGGECDVEAVEVKCSTEKATTQIKAIHEARLRDAARTNPRVLEDQSAVDALQEDCMLQTTGAWTFKEPNDKAVCRGFSDNLLRQGADEFYEMRYVECVDQCALRVGLVDVAQCSRTCMRGHFPWLPDWAFTYTSKVMREIEEQAEQGRSRAQQATP